MLDVPQDAERFKAELPGLAAGRRILFDELARLVKPEVELTVSEFADRYRVVSPESGSPFSWTVADGSRALSARADGLLASRPSGAARHAEILGADRKVGDRRQLVLLHRRSRAGPDADRAPDRRRGGQVQPG